MRVSLLLSLPAVALATGCDNPNCSVNLVLSDETDQIVDFDSAGENLCKHSELSGIVVLEFYRELGVAFNGVESLQVNVQAPSLAVGTYGATVVVGETGRSLTADAQSCTVTISELDIEDWTVTDYVNFTGTVACTGPLELIGGGGTTMAELGPTQFQGHVLYE